MTEQTTIEPKQNGHHPAVPGPTLPISPLFTDAPMQTHPLTENLRELVDAMWSDEKLRQRSNIPMRLWIHVVKLETFAMYCDDHHLPNTAAYARGLSQYMLDTFMGVKGWGTGNLIKALQARQTMIGYGLSGEGGGMGIPPERARGIGRLFGR